MSLSTRVSISWYASNCSPSGHDLREPLDVGAGGLHGERHHAHVVRRSDSRRLVEADARLDVHAALHAVSSRVVEKPRSQPLRRYPGGILVKRVLLLWPPWRLPRAELRVAAVGEPRLAATLARHAVILRERGSMGLFDKPDLEKLKRDGDYGAPHRLGELHQERRGGQEGLALLEAGSLRSGRVPLRDRGVDAGRTPGTTDVACPAAASRCCRRPPMSCHDRQAGASVPWSIRCVPTMSTATPISRRSFCISASSSTSSNAWAALGRAGCARSRATVRLGRPRPGQAGAQTARREGAARRRLTLVAGLSRSADGYTGAYVADATSRTRRKRWRTALSWATTVRRRLGGLSTRQSILPSRCPTARSSCLRRGAHRPGVAFGNGAWRRRVP